LPTWRIRLKSGIRGTGRHAGPFCIGFRRDRPSRLSSTGGGDATSGYARPVLDSGRLARDQGHDGTLSFMKNSVISALREFGIDATSAELWRIAPEDRFSQTESGRILAGILATRELVRQGRDLLQKRPEDIGPQLGSIMRRQHEIIRRNFNLSTPRIEQFISLAAANGALGEKINGSAAADASSSCASRKEHQV